jgi:multiple antibiotic resistance protein
MTEYLQYVALGLATILPLANPLTSTTLLLALGDEFTKEERNQQIGKATLYVAAIFVVCFYGGNAIISFLGISLAGLRIAGGLVVAYIGFTMLFPGSVRSETHAQTRMSESDVATDSSGIGRPPRTTPRDIAFVPLAMPGTAGPGTIAVLVSAASTLESHGGLTPSQHMAFFTVTAIIVILFWASLRSANRVLSVLGESGIDAISRVMGFLLICVGVQFGIDGTFELLAGRPAIEAANEAGMFAQGAARNS